MPGDGPRGSVVASTEDLGDAQEHPVQLLAGDERWGETNDGVMGLFASTPRCGTSREAAGATGLA